ASGMEVLLGGTGIGGAAHGVVEGVVRGELVRRDRKSGGGRLVEGGDELQDPTAVLPTGPGAAPCAHVLDEEAELGSVRAGFVAVRGAQGGGGVARPVRGGSPGPVGVVVPVEVAQLDGGVGEVEPQVAGLPRG